MKLATERLHQERLIKSLIYIQSNIDGDLPLQEIAAISNYSPYHFHRVFKSLLGESVGDYIRRLRLQRATMRLVYSDICIASIASEAGYETQESFSRAFKLAYKNSPSYYRNIHAKLNTLRCAAGMLCCRDFNATYIDATDRLAKSLGFSNVDALLGKKISQVNCSIAELAEDFAIQDRNTLLQNKASTAIDIVCYANNPVTVYMTNRTPLYNGKGIPCNVFIQVSEVKKQGVCRIIKYLKGFDDRINSRIKICASYTVDNGFSHLSLTSLESECLFYFLRKIPKNKLATILNKSKKQTEKVIAIIMQKIGCTSEVHLFEKATSLGFFNILPKNLINYKMIYALTE